ncbi:hypothetical protein BAE29_02985 [Acidithiobacillus caldus]|uniref:Uncharacterized protein n=1 Tax=Acidithiobacillus caldus TaxID=33059 RepID=A0A1E7YIR4_9PROT|nr:hypothetical protein BAE27_15150 [Acidithiobacillus caldus]OFC35503.1 hypothetical protein BAE28_10360 [Acidithiobacillus caldus]OFC41367.1 hypothetical protein BAE29_02985 [Acidithiobacillus caldus]
MKRREILFAFLVAGFLVFWLGHHGRVGLGPWPQRRLYGEPPPPQPSTVTFQPTAPLNHTNGIPNAR